MHESEKARPPSPSLSRRRLLRLAVGAAPGLLLSSATGAAEIGAQALHIGFVGPFSGPARDTGLEIRQGILMALKDARDEGEIPARVEGVRRDIQPLWVDSASDPERAVIAVRRALTRDHAAMFVGGWHSDVALALMDAEAPYGVMHLGHAGEALSIAERINSDYQKYRGWFKGWPTPALLGARYGEPLRYLRRQGLWRPRNDRVAIMAENTAYGQGWGEALFDSLQSSGFSVAQPQLTGPGQMEFGELMQSYRRDKISLVLMSTTDGQAATAFVRQFREHQVPALLVGHGLRWSRDWYATTGEASNYVIAMDSAMPMALWQQWWVRRYRYLFGDMPSIAAAGIHYDYTRMAIRILNATASLDLDDLIRTVYRLPYRGVWNRYQFASEPMENTVSANEVQAGSFMEGFFFPLAQLMDGEARIIWPPRYADQRFIAPPWL
ncbi:branched chain amino acid ABC transporter substrate-binding protein [Marinobacterium nitratireducens]|uniref:Branched chain amino acid ABC transporter substrate-binding protein n=1 Tax=Marinobacterium nitratireducens TaxID=518897 RepID=A0A917Z6K0_9GAMM|nr:ABC transporter substrate-binding protein [Marinobacterium nitratireducens]GGO76682.1 branched chain amino acid ABC transporter substrate-binding protein [Marinobacterium nitratireducens]